MRKLGQPVGTSIRLALQDMWQFYGPRVLIGLSVAILAVVLALIVTGQATLWTLWAYAIFLGGTYLICLGLRLTGWHRLWEPSHREQTSPSRHLQLQLDFKGLPAMRLATVPHEFTCEARDPSGARFKTRPGTVGGGGSAVWCNYPSDFDGASALVPGTYNHYVERTTPSAGSWATTTQIRRQMAPNGCGPFYALKTSPSTV